MYKRAYVKVDLDRIRKNMKAIRSVLPEGTKIIGVVKADGYGMGRSRPRKPLKRTPQAMRWPRRRRHWSLEEMG